MSSVTYEQIAEAIPKLPVLAQRQLLTLLQAQPGVGEKLSNTDPLILSTAESIRQLGLQFEEQWIASLQQNPDDAGRAEDWLEAQAWSDL